MQRPAGQQDIHAKAAGLLKQAAAEQDLGRRIGFLQESQEVLLRSEVDAATVGSCLEFFLNLQADPHVAVRRYAAHFLDRLLFFKPFLALRCTPAVTSLLGDPDRCVQELALRAAITLHGRALLQLAAEREILQFQRHHEQLQKLSGAIVALLLGGCPEQPSLFQLAARWAKVSILAQTPSPLAIRVRVPPELRGVGCLEDFPEKATYHLDLGKVHQQADERLAMLCKLLETPPDGMGKAWPRGHARALLSALGAAARQRPAMLRQVLDSWCRTLVKAEASPTEAGNGASNGQAKSASTTSELRELVWDEVLRLMASNLTAERRAEMADLLRSAGLAGCLEDLATQAKYRQLCSAAERWGTLGEPKAKRRRTTLARRLWVGAAALQQGPEQAARADEDAFDGDAQLCGEAESACRRFEDYFGLPSQREPAGHVPGPALLASRANTGANLARIALTSLTSLSMKRSLLRDRVHERVIAFNEPSFKAQKSKKEARSEVHSQDLALFITGNVPTEQGQPDAGGEDADSPEALKMEGSRAPRFLSAGAIAVAESGDAPLAPLEGSMVQLPPQPAARERLQLRLFRELLESQRRMHKSLMAASMSDEQLDRFQFVSRQVALHLASGTHGAISYALQRQMCQVYMLNAFEALKLALDPKTATPGAGPAVLGTLVELFFAKFSTDVARFQENAGHTKRQVAEAAAKTPLRDILEGPAGRAKASGGSFTYSDLFGMFVAEFERNELPRRELRTFLNEIPLVPLSAFRLLEAQCQVASARKMALLTVLSLLDNKPSCRWHCLQLLFKLAYSGGDDSSIRFDTIRLIINKIYSAGPHAAMRWQLPHLSDVEAAALPDGEGGASWDLPDDESLPLQRLKGRCVEDVATLMLRSVAPPGARFQFPVGAPIRLDRLRGDLFEGAVCAPKDRVWLYLALCIKRPVLLHELVETFTLCDAEMKEHLINSIEEAIKHIPASEREVLELARKATPDTERLVLKVLHILMQASQGKDGQPLSPEYGQAVTKLYGATQNPRLLVPVFDLLDRKSLLDFLPAVLQLEEEEVTNAFRQLVGSRSPPLSITELLTELHHMNSPAENIVPVKCSMQALNILFGMRDQFDPKVYGIVVQALVEEPGRLPTLFMRTVIQVVKELPRLADFMVVEILPRLARQEVWGDQNLWRGFMIVLQHTFASQPAGAARVLTMLPITQLEDVLVQHPDWKAPLLEYASRQPAGVVPPHVRQLLQ